MAINVGNSAVLSDTAGQISDIGASCKVLCIAIKTALVGTLTLANLTQASGATVPWVIPATSLGVFTPPGPSTGTAWGFRYVYSNPVDVGSAIAAWMPT